jgi:hypothetical protein
MVKRRRVLAAAGALVLVALLVWLAWLGTRAPSPGPPSAPDEALSGVTVGVEDTDAAAASTRRRTALPGPPAHDTGAASGESVAAPDARPVVPHVRHEFTRPDYELEGGVPLAGLDPVQASVRMSRAPRGLEGEVGRTLGTLDVSLSRDAPRDLVFALRSVPQGAVLFGDVPEMRLPAGRNFTLYNFAAAQEGRARVELTLLDDDRQPTSSVLAVDVEAVSVARLSEPVLAARFGPPGALGPGYQRGSSESATGLPGLYLGPIEVRRGGFADFDRAETVFRVEVDDPEGILEPLPSVVTIPAGRQSNVDRPRVVLRAREGEARILLRHGGQVLELRVESAPPIWSVPPEFELTRGHPTHLTVSLTQVPRYVDTVHVVSSHPDAVRVPEEPIPLTSPGWPVLHVPLEAGTGSEAVLQIRPKGLAPREVRVRVVDE